MLFKLCGLFLLLALKPISCCNSKKYIVGEGSLTWHQSYQKCKAHNMELASITSEDDKKEISSVLNKCKPKDGVNKGMWLGGHKLKNNKWIWSSNGLSVSGYEMWGPGQPNNMGRNERCMEIYREQGNWYWNDIECEKRSTRKRYICQNRS